MASLVGGGRDLLLPSLVLSAADSEPDHREWMEELGPEDEWTTALSPLSSARLDWPLQSRREAQYMMYYIRDLSTWLDVCDVARSFGTLVPQRARQSPLLAFSILAWGSRNWTLRHGIEDPACETYYSRAISILISALDDPVKSADENTLAAIVLLRSYEEYSDADTATHLLGSARLLNSAANFAFQGGLGEATSWLVLRQDMYLSVTRSLPLRINLDNYRRSDSFQSQTAEALANRAVFLSAAVLQAAFGAGENGLDSATWAGLSDEVAQWHASLPWRFGPYYSKSTTDADAVADTPGFPVLRMMRPAYVIGYQHYHLSLMILAIFNPELWIPSAVALRKRPAADAAVRLHIRHLVGLAISNPNVITGCFLASHVLFAYSDWLEDRTELEAAREFLQTMYSRTGWRVAEAVERLNQRLSVA